MENIYVKDIPQDLVKHILQTQWDMKVNKGAGQFSQSKTIVHIIREHKKLAEKKKAG